MNENKNNIKILEEKRKFYIKDVDRINKDIIDLKMHMKELIRKSKDFDMEILDDKKLLETLKFSFEQKNAELNKTNDQMQLEEIEIEKEKK